jgi:signal transduction histidine kinase
METTYQRQMEAYGVELEERVRRKTRELAEANERLSILDRAKDDFLRLISHELRTPITGVVGASDALTEGEMDEDTRNAAAQLLRDSVARLARIVEDALLLTSVRVSDPFTLEARGLRPIASEAAARVSRLAEPRGIRVEQTLDDGCRVLCDERLLTDALAALIECAVKFSASQRAVRMESALLEDAVRVTIRASGAGVPAALIPRFFEILSLGVEPLTPGGDLGLGPAVAAQILRLLGGSVEVESDENGISFVVMLRSAHDAPHGR